jgi:hypothetical protein
MIMAIKRRGSAMNALVVYYSLSGITRTVATAVAKELGADLEEIRCERYRPGFFGSLRAAYDSWAGKLPPIEPLSRAPADYALIVICGPIWVFHPATPLRTFLRKESANLPDVAFVLTHRESAARQPLREMEELSGHSPKAALVVREADVGNGEFSRAASKFASSLRATCD